MSILPQTYLTTPEQVYTLLLDSKFASDVPTEGQSQYNDFFAFLAEVIPKVSQEVMGMCGDLSFIPYYDTKEWQFSNLAESFHFISVKTGVRLYLQDFLLEISSIVWDEDTLTEYNKSTKLGDFIALPTRDYPFRYIDFDSGSVQSMSTDFGRSVDIAGYWGYHTDPNQLYLTSPDLEISIDDSVVEITVASGGYYQTYQYLRIEDELLFISSISGNVLTVMRGQNGSTKVAHVAVPIQTIQPMRDVQSLAAYMSAYNYQNRNMIADSIQISDVGVLIPKFPQRYVAIMDRYTNKADAVMIAGAY